ncbi:MAG: hypothetical protein K0Q87_1603 [Neobacillus sp.]|jgi:short-subunit dehydrogenase|nr:hypothetical protein [Neobacillus sp.]
MNKRQMKCILIDQKNEYANLLRELDFDVVTINLINNVGKGTINIFDVSEIEQLTATMRG